MDFFLIDITKRYETCTKAANLSGRHMLYSVESDLEIDSVKILLELSLPAQNVTSLGYVFYKEKRFDIHIST